MVGLVASVSPMRVLSPVALSNQNHSARYCDGGCAKPRATAAFSNVSVPAASSVGLTIGLIAGKYARPTASRRFISTDARYC